MRFGPDAFRRLCAARRLLQQEESGRIAVKVINHLGDEVMKVFRIG
jgi:adenine-specific DNA-methyltransferase